MLTHKVELLVVDGIKEAHCEWRHVENGRWDIVNRVIAMAGSPFKTYKALIEREDGWLSHAKANRYYYCEVIEKNEVNLDRIREGGVEK